MSDPKVQNTQNPPSRQSAPSNTDSAHSFSEDEIRTRAYQIYESGDRNATNPEADWSQAQTELMELLHARYSGRVPQNLP